MKVTLVGTGCGDPGTMTEEVKRTIAEADVLIGAPRLLEAVEGYADPGILKVAEIKPAEILDAIQRTGAAEDAVAAIKGTQDGRIEINVCVAYSGDSGFYSGTRSLLPLLHQAGIETDVMPGISSIQVMAARLQVPWQDWKLVSAHGTDCDPVCEVMEGKEVFFLTGGALGPAELCAKLADAGLGELRVIIGERLSYADEKILVGKAADFAEREFDSLSVMLAEPAEVTDRTPGIDDSAFIRGDIPMTKQTVRDVGAGTGSVSVELAMKANRGSVWAVEREPEGCELIEENKKKFGVWNLHVVSGSAPEALADLPAPDRVFIGGSDGTLEEIMDAALEKNGDALICVSAIVLEIRDRHMMMAGNPIYIITGKKNA